VPKGAAQTAHSLRAGFLTSAARRGASVFKMRGTCRHGIVSEVDTVAVLTAPLGQLGRRSPGRKLLAALFVGIVLDF
jgi:hypothetical protein